MPRAKLRLIDSKLFIVRPQKWAKARTKKSTRSTLVTTSTVTYKFTVMKRTTNRTVRKAKQSVLNVSGINTL